MIAQWKGQLRNNCIKKDLFCQFIKLEKTHKISCECWFEWLLTCLKYCSEAKTSSLAKDTIMYEAKSALIQCKLDFIGSIAKKNRNESIEPPVPKSLSASLKTSIPTFYETTQNGDPGNAQTRWNFFAWPLFYQMRFSVN